MPDGRPASTLRWLFAEELALLRDSWSLYRRESGPLTWGALIVGTIFMLVLFFLGGALPPALLENTGGRAIVFVALDALLLSPLFGGLLSIALAHLRTGRRGSARGVFSGYQSFLAIALAGLPASLVFEVRWALRSSHAQPALRFGVLAFSLLLWLLLIYLVPAIVDQRAGFPAALQTAQGLLRPPELWRTLAALIVLVALGFLIQEPANLLGSATALATLYLFVVAIVCIPFAVAYVASMYVRARETAEARSASEVAV